MTRPRIPLGFYVPTAGPHDSHTLIATVDDERPWWCEDCEVSLTEEELGDRGEREEAPA